MDQKEVISKIAKELQSISDITPTDWLTIKPYFEYVFGVGYDEGRAVHSHRKKVEQLKDGKVIGTFDSSYDAANSVGVDSSSIRNAVNGIRKTCAGYNWRSVTT
jgi:hypothetical protein